jgi:thymidylate kinase
VDAHYQLVIGHDRTKNHRLPIEGPYLASARHRGLLKVPSAEFEYVAFVIRMVLKYALWDEILWEALRRRALGLTETEQRELVHLEASIDRDALSSIMDEHLPWLDRRVFDASVAVARGEVSLAQRLSTGRSLRAALSAFARRGAVADGSLRVWRRLVLGVQKRTNRAPRFRLPGGGMLVGIMGGDGSGKSTAVGEIGRWLETEFDVRRIHLGKPPWSMTTYGVRGTLKVATVLGSKLSRGSTRGSSSVDPDTGYRSMLWLVCAARDRYRCYRRARRFVNRGGLVLSDRYPHRGLTSMDVAQIARLKKGADTNAIAATLMQLEGRYHERIALPELLVLLQVDPETAARRKTDEPPDYVRRRVAELRDVDWESMSVRVIDARQPKDAVASELKSLIWTSL